MMSWITLYANWKYDPYMVVRVRSFLELYIFNLNEAKVTDTLSSDDKMPRISVAIWDMI